MNESRYQLSWPAVFGLVAVAGAVVVWPTVSHALWVAGKPALHLVPAIFAGLFLVVTLSGLLRLILAIRERGSGRLGRALFRVISSTLVLGLSVVALFYGVERWRGSHAYARAAETARSLGETLDLREIQPARIPDEENLLAIPMLAPFQDFTYGVRDATGNEVWADLGPLNPVQEWGRKRILRQESGGRLPPWLQGERLELGRWTGKEGAATASTSAAAEAQARDLLERLSSLEPMLGVMAEASRRPECQLPPSDLNPLFSKREVQLEQVLVGFVHLYSVRALAHLRLGDADRALQELEPGFNLGVHLVRMPSGEGYERPRALAVADLLQPVWEGMQDGRWNVDQLQTLQNRLTELRPRDELRHRLRAQRLVHADLVETVIPTRSPVQEGLPQSESDLAALRWIRLVYPRGWSLLNQAAIHQFYFELSGPVERPVDYLNAPERRLVRQLLRGSSDPCFGVFMTPRVVQSVVDSWEYLTFSQATVNLALTACALEQYRLRHVAYPEGLDDLQPDLLTVVPADPVNGAPLHYRVDRTGGYRLYSVCLDERDDSGAFPVERTSGPILPRPPGDWVWQVSRGGSEGN